MARSKLKRVQQQVITMIGPHETVWHGLKECMSKGLVSNRTFHNEWMKDPEFVAALNAERERVQDELPTRLKNLAIAEADTMFRALIEIAKGEISAKRDQLEAIKYVLERAGIDSGGLKERANLLVLIQQRILQEAPASDDGDEVARQ